MNYKNNGKNVRYNKFQCTYTYSYMLGIKTEVLYYHQVVVYFKIYNKWPELSSELCAIFVCE